MIPFSTLVLISTYLRAKETKTKSRAAAKELAGGVVTLVQRHKRRLTICWTSSTKFCLFHYRILRHRSGSADSSSVAAESAYPRFGRREKRKGDGKEEDMGGQWRDSVHCRSLNPTPRNTTLAPPGNGTGWWLDQPRFCAFFGCQSCAKEGEDLSVVMEDPAIPSPFGVLWISGIFLHCFFLIRSVDPVARSSCFPRPGIMLLTKGCSLDDELKRGLRVSQNTTLFPQRKHLLKDRDSGKGRPVLLVSHDDYTHQAKCFEHLSRIVWVICLALSCLATCYDYNYWAHGVFVRMGVVGSIFLGEQARLGGGTWVGGWVEANLDTRLGAIY